MMKTKKTVTITSIAKILGLVLVLCALAGCNSYLTDMLKEPGKTGGGGTNPQVVDTSYPVLRWNAFMGGSVLYAAEAPSSGHLVPGAVVGVRLGKVNHDPIAGAEGAAEPGPEFSENTDSTRYGYITVETVDTKGIGFQYTEYTADGKSSAVKGNHRLALGEEKDINGDGIPDISWTAPGFSRPGFERAVTLNFLSSSELENFTTTMFAVLPEQYENNEYPSGIIGINPDGQFIVTKYTTTGTRAMVRGIATGDLVIDAVNYQYKQAIISKKTYRSARAIADEDMETEDVESPDLYFPIMSVDFSYEIEIENVDPDALQLRQSRAALPTQTDYQRDQARIRSAFSGYTPVTNIPISLGSVKGSLKLGVSGTKTNVWGTIELKTSVVALIDASLIETSVKVGRGIEYSLLTKGVAVSASLGNNLKFNLGKSTGVSLLKDRKFTIPIVPQVFWIDVTPSIIFDYIIAVNAEVDVPLKGGFTGLYGATMTVGANYGIEWFLRPYLRPYAS
jgi:hypothetical protein